MGNSFPHNRMGNGHFATVGIRPLGDSRYGNLLAGKLPFIRDGLLRIGILKALFDVTVKYQRTRCGVY